MAFTVKEIAYAETDFDTKFGVPRQSGRVTALEARIVFLPKYRNPDALRGIEGFSHLWLLWQFSENREARDFRPTVRPPRLGGNRMEGVFATRSPYRPNPIGLSCVKLLRVEHTENEGAVLIVSGADLVNGTPILDIKPYLPFADAHPEATGGFATSFEDYALDVFCEEEVLLRLPENKREALLAVLREDPRPAYQSDPSRVYGFPFAGYEIKFTVEKSRLEVLDILPNEEKTR